MVEKVTVYFVNGTTVEVIRPSVIKVDPQLRVLMLNDEAGDGFNFVLDSVKYFLVRNSKVVQ